MLHTAFYCKGLELVQISQDLQLSDYDLYLIFRGSINVSLLSLIESVLYSLLHLLDYLLDEIIKDCRIDYVLRVC